MSHDHIYGMIGAVQRGGGELVAAWAGEPDKLATFAKRYPDVKMVKTQEEIIEDPSIQLVLSSQIANERAPLGVKAMRHGKDYLSDKPGITTLEQLAEVRKTIAETKKIYAITVSYTHLDVYKRQLLTCSTSRTRIRLSARCQQAAAVSRNLPIS